MTGGARTGDGGTGVRAVVRLGLAVALALGLPLTGFGLLGLGTGIGQAMLCLGAVLLVAAAGGIARERVERAHAQHPPEPRLDRLDGEPALHLPDGEPALHLPRASGRSAVSAWTTAGLGGVALAGGVLALTAGATGGAVVLLVLGALLLAVARPWRGRGSTSRCR
ncbi:hypothetical protein [Nocardioides sp. SYSU DS0663]|uniref:hypothetical protein n=1 Tax=Nocardioides sp. SYSU DS0663 TaxID=3416445 RepID=UPI003F4C544A